MSYVGKSPIPYHWNGRTQLNTFCFTARCSPTGVNQISQSYKITLTITYRNHYRLLTALGGYVHLHYSDRPTYLICSNCLILINSYITYSLLTISSY